MPVDLLPAVRGSAAARVAAQQHALLARSAAAGGLSADGAAWVEQACAQVLTQLRTAPATTRAVAWAVGRDHGRCGPPVEDWTPGHVAVLSQAEGYAELVRRWLWAYGPGTEADLLWWLGATKRAVRSALSRVGAVAVQLQDGSPV